MGIDIGSKLIVGRKAGDVIPFLMEKVDEGLYEDEMDALEDLFDYASPWYDSPMAVWIVGVEVNSYAKEGVWVADALDSATHEFESVTGIKPLVYCVPHVT